MVSTSIEFNLKDNEEIYYHRGTRLWILRYPIVFFIVLFNHCENEFIL